MDVHSVRLKLAIVASLGLATFLGWFVLQRLWYAWRTRPMPSIETVSPRFFPDALLGLVSGLLAWFGLAGFFTIPDLDGFRSVRHPAVLCEIEVASEGPQGRTLLVYDRLDPEAPEAARRRGVLQVPSAYSVEVQRVSFGPILWLIGQPDLVRIVAIRRVGPDGSIIRPTGSRRAAEAGSELQLSSPITTSIYRWPFFSGSEMLAVPASDFAAPVQALVLNNGELSIQSRSARR